jgi:hypothetical protein
MNTFKVVSGKHHQRVGDEVITYREGDLVHSDYDLDKTFRNKFVRVVQPGAATPPAVPAVPAPAPAPANPDAPRTTPPMTVPDPAVADILSSSW